MFIATNEPTWYDLPPVTLANLCMVTVSRPHNVPLEYADNNIMLSHLTWLGWFHVVLLPFVEFMALLVFVLAYFVQPILDGRLSWLIFRVGVKDAAFAAGGLLGIRRKRT